MLRTMYKTHPGGKINENAVPVGDGSTNSNDMLTLTVRSQGQEGRLKVKFEKFIN